MKTWFITGASRGFGAVITQAVLASGDAVVATARDPSSIADHPRLLKLALDVTNEGQARDAAARGIEKFGRVDVLVNNAGYGLLGAGEEASAIEVECVFATNVFGVTKIVLLGGLCGVQASIHRCAFREWFQVTAARCWNSGRRQASVTRAS